jgi:ketosteroid isomerase-like protein
VTFEAEMQAFMNAMATAYKAGDAQACAQMFVTDGMLYSPYAFPARGHAEIEALHRVWTAGAKDKELRVVNAARSGDIGWCLVAYSEEDATGNGTSLSVVELQPDGKWLIRICSLNNDEPPLLE